LRVCRTRPWALVPERGRPTRRPRYLAAGAGAVPQRVSVRSARDGLVDDVVAEARGVDEARCWQRTIEQVGHVRLALPGDQCLQRLSSPRPIKAAPNTQEIRDVVLVDITQIVTAN